MMKYAKIITLLLAVLMVLSLSACDKKMSEEEIEEACVKATETFVGGYLSNTSTNYLEKYTPYPEDDLENCLLRPDPFF